MADMNRNGVIQEMENAYAIATGAGVVSSVGMAAALARAGELGWGLQENNAITEAVEARDVEWRRNWRLYIPAEELQAFRQKAIEAERTARLVAQERWQRLVNEIASAFTGGPVVGDDDMAVENAILHVKQVAERLAAIETRSRKQEGGGDGTGTAET